MDYPLSKNSDFSHNKDHIGVELEVEFEVEEGPYPSVAGWSSVPEGSLRNGVEYVTKHPTNILDLPRKAKALYAKLEEFGVQSSIRCSTHVHINVGHLEEDELHVAILLYYLLEESFLATQPPKRRGNLFCLRLQDARALESTLKDVFSGDKKLTSLAANHNQYKYAAMNLAAVGRLGTLEFRFFDMATSADYMTEITQAMWYMINTCIGKTPSMILEEFDSNLTTEDFTKKYNLLFKYIPEGFNFKDGALTNYSFVSDVVKILNPVKKGYIKSFAGVNEDIGSDGELQ